ncbi:3-oxoacyl-[acyl-carrier-protein] reductase FabG, partial [Leucoagaricus sp. SymC.cos]
IQKIQSHLDNAPRGSKLKDKVCIITSVGSLKGIGQEVIPATVQQADAADEDAVKGICERAMKEEGRLGVFFTNAGFASKQPLHDTSKELFMETMRVNTLSCFLAIKHTSIAMLKPNPAAGKEHSSGSIILTASVSSLRSGGGTIDYSTSKAAVNSMAKTSAYQLQKCDIRVNSICPSLVETAMTAYLFKYGHQRGLAGKLGQLIPLGCFGAPECVLQHPFPPADTHPNATEIAQAGLFIALDNSSYVNGQKFAVDGGVSSSHPVVPGRPI